MTSEHQARLEREEACRGLEQELAEEKEKAQGLLGGLKHAEEDLKMKVRGPLTLITNWGHRPHSPSERQE